MTVPIFVLGVQRSGTTWLANQLCQSEQIAGVQHESHYGIHESAFFSLMEGRYGDLSNRSNFVEFAEIALASDYFLLANVRSEELYQQFGSSYQEIFRTIMDAFATRQGALFWVEKSPGHTKCAARIASYYPDAKFVAIVREATDVVQSSMARRVEASARKATRYLFIWKRTHAWALHRKSIRSFQRSYPRRIICIEYRHLVEDKEATMRAVCDFLGIAFSEQMMIDKYAPDTSYSSEKARNAMRITIDERLLIRLLVSMMERFPLALLNWLRSPKKSARRPLPQWFFRLGRSSNDDDREFGKKRF